MSPNQLQLQAQRNLFALGENPYPGRGLVIGREELGDYLVHIYWIMGRSENSRNRVFEYDEAEKRLFTVPADPSKVKDPSLIIYNAMRHWSGCHIVSNGSQTDAVAHYPGDIMTASYDYQYEPDAPNFTPRITGLTLDERRTDAQILILKKAPHDDSCQQQLFVYPTLPAGIGYCVTTYRGEGNPLPSFEGEPYPVPIKGDPHEILDSFWNTLNPNNRVSLAVKIIKPQRSIVFIKNQYEKVSAAKS